MVTDAHSCEQCGAIFDARIPRRFCCDKCKAEWHRSHSPAGEVRSVRRMTNGRVAVIVHFAEHEAERALRFQPQQGVVLGTA